MVISGQRWVSSWNIFAQMRYHQIVICLFSHSMRFLATLLPLLVVIIGLFYTHSLQCLEKHWSIDKDVAITVSSFCSIPYYSASRRSSPSFSRTGILFSKTTVLWQLAWSRWSDLQFNSCLLCELCWHESIKSFYLFSKRKFPFWSF